MGNFIFYQEHIMTIISYIISAIFFALGVLLLTGHKPLGLGYEVGLNSGFILIIFSILLAKRLYTILATLLFAILVYWKYFDGIYFWNLYEPFTKITEIPTTILKYSSIDKIISILWKIAILFLIYFFWLRPATKRENIYFDH